MCCSSVVVWDLMSSTSQGWSWHCPSSSTAQVWIMEPNYNYSYKWHIIIVTFITSISTLFFFINQSVSTLFLTHLRYSKPILTSCFNALHLLSLFSTPPLQLSKLCSEALTLKNFNCIPHLMFLTVKTQEHMLYHYHKF